MMMKAISQPQARASRGLVEGAVFLGEVLGRGLDGGREVAGFTNGQNHAAGQEEPNGNGRQGGDAAASQA